MVDEKLFCEIMRGAGARVHERARRASCAAHGGDNDQAVSWRLLPWEDGPATNATVVKWHCFTGDHGGDVITFVREAYKMEFMDAIVALEETIKEYEEGR